MLDAYFSGTKIKWILDNVPGAQEKAERGELLFGTVDTWLVWKLTDGKVHITDYTNASRTMLYDIHKRCPGGMMKSWKLDSSPDRCSRLRCHPARHLWRSDPAALLGGRQVPIAGIAGDQQAALFGQCLLPGDAKNTYGTGCFLLMNTGEKPVFSKERPRHHHRVSVSNGKVEYALEGLRLRCRRRHPVAARRDLTNISISAIILVAKLRGVRSDDPLSLITARAISAV